MHASEERDRATRGALRVALLVALILSAAFALLGQPQLVSLVRAGDIRPEWLLVAPVLFFVFVVLTGVDALFVARRRGFLNGRALFQVLIALGFVAFLAPQAYAEYRARKAPPTTSIELLEQLSRHKDARVRAVVIDLAGYRAEQRDLARLLLRAFDDNDPKVREAALQAFQRRYGASAPVEREEAREIVQRWLDAKSPVGP